MLVGQTLRLLVAGPFIGTAYAASLAAEAVNQGCRRIEGPRAKPRRPLGLAALETIASREHAPPAAELARYRRACFALWREGFDTADIAELLMEAESDVARWLFQAREAAAKEPAVSR